MLRKMLFIKALPDDQQETYLNYRNPQKNNLIFFYTAEKQTQKDGGKIHSCFHHRNI